jgi:hypothetical protein
VDRPVALIPLQCVQCSTPLAAQPGEVAWVCPVCGQGNLLDEKMGLERLDVHYSTAIPANGRGKPYWVALGRVALRRETFKGNQMRDAEKYWSRPRRFYIPAFECPLDVLLPLGRRMLEQQAHLLPGSAAPFDAVVLPLKDVRSAAEFIVMAVEADRKDKLRKVEFILELETADLWILP